MHKIKLITAIFINNNDKKKKKKKKKKKNQERKYKKDSHYFLIQILRINIFVLILSSVSSDFILCHVF
jgi:hypothetical protein